VIAVDRLKLQNISSSYYYRQQKLPVLDKISLSVKTGEFVSVLGPSGSGKSTILKIAAGLLQPEVGQVLIDGLDLTSQPRLVGYMPQRDLLFDWKTLKQNAALPLLAAGLSKKEAHTRVEQMLPVFGLQGFSDYYPYQLSGGMRKRASLARTIVVDPLIMLYDEPTTGLDPVTSDGISSLINDVQKKYKTSSIIITHDIECARATADRVIMLQDGEVYMEGNIDDFENSTDELIQSFFKQKT